mmetsp:Transcript_15788/g.39247  ORF Transcript_15788/g.39247 Transcript_15788/m.39247 type:complete len:407 (-) Transcript_15788:2567-3787(-)
MAAASCLPTRRLRALLAFISATFSFVLICSRVSVSSSSSSSSPSSVYAKTVATEEEDPSGAATRDDKHTNAGIGPLKSLTPSVVSANINISDVRAKMCSCPFIVEHHKCPSCQTDPLLERSLADLVRVAAAAADNDDDNVRNARILFLGDSIPWQRSQLAKCALEHVLRNATVLFDGMYVFPVTVESFRQFFQDLLDRHHPTIVVFGIGTWYNWDWEQPAALHGSNSISTLTTMEILNGTCMKHGVTFDMLSQTSKLYDRTLAMRICKEFFNRSSFISGLLRLKALLEKRKQQTTSTEQRPIIVWTDVPPQHFATPSGQFSVWQSPGGGCRPIQNTSIAYGRNEDPSSILKDFVLFSETWKNDLSSWDSHASRTDCTHYCNPSPTTVGWFLELLTVLLSSSNAFLK